MSAPTDVLLRRIESRTTNDYGKTIEERRLILSQLSEVEPLLRATCTHEVDATQPLPDVVAQLVDIGRGMNAYRHKMLLRATTVAEFRILPTKNEKTPPAAGLS